MRRVSIGGGRGSNTVLTVVVRTRFQTTRGATTGGSLWARSRGSARRKTHWIHAPRALLVYMSQIVAVLASGTVVCPMYRRLIPIIG